MSEVSLENIDLNHSKRLHLRKSKIALKGLLSLIPEEGVEVNIEGEKFKIKKFFAPKNLKENEEEKWCCGIDAWFQDSHIEITATVTGWGGCPVEKLKLIPTD